MAFFFRGGILEASDGSVGAEDFEKFSDEHLCFGLFVFCVFPSDGEGDGIGLDGFPGEHGSIVACLNGFWYSAKMDALLAFIKEAQKPVSGTAILNLYKGNIVVQNRSSENSLYDEGLATMEGGGSFNQNDATLLGNLLQKPAAVGN